MIQRYNRLFGEDEKEMTFRVTVSHNQKVYEEGDKKLAVWSLQSCVKGLRDARLAGDTMLTKAANNAAEFYDKNKVLDPMTQAWNEDCRQVWMKAYDQVLEEEAPPPPAKPKKSLFNKDQ